MAKPASGGGGSGSSDKAKPRRKRGADPTATKQGAIQKLASIAEGLHALASVRVEQAGDSRDELAQLMRRAGELAARARVGLQREAGQHGDSDSGKQQG